MQAPYWKISPTDLVAVLTARSYDNSLLTIINDEEKLKNIGVKDTESFLKINKVLQKARSLSLTETPAQVLEFLLQESGLLDFALKQFQDTDRT